MECEDVREDNWELKLQNLPHLLDNRLSTQK